jgi:hypothetical protein
MNNTPHWLSPPNVDAPSPDDPGANIRLGMSESYIKRHAETMRVSPVYWLWVHAVGELPPINNVSRVMKGLAPPTLTKLGQSVACFRGVNRPYDDDENGHSVVVYVLNPTVTIEFEKDMACMAKAMKVPVNTALTVQARLRKSLQAQGETVDGIITRVEFVVGVEEGNLVLPRDYATRYSEDLWRNP